MTTLSKRKSWKRSISALRSIGLGIALMLPLSTPGATGSDRGSRFQSSNGTSRIFLPYVLAISTRFTDASTTLTLDNGTVKVVLDKVWGGAIRELWHHGVNLINNFDGGRLSGISLYDDQTVPPSGSISDPNWGWNPTPSDIYDHANPPLAYHFSDGVLYVRARNLHWNPSNKGGGPAQPVHSDVLVETWVDLPTTTDSGVHVKYRVTHDGTDLHARWTQEIGYVYIRPAYRRFVRYAGDAPWTNGPVAIRETPPVWPSTGESATSEHWGGFVNADDFGLVLWAPQAYPRFGYVFHDAPPPPDNSTSYMNPMTFMEHEPGSVYEMEQYLFAGRWQDARAQIYALRQALGQIPDVLPGFGYIDLPVPDATLSGVIEVAGWALDDRGIEEVEVLLDGRVAGEAQYGQLRDDVQDVYPGFPDTPYVGFRYLLNTTRYRNGSHTIQARAVDASGNTTFLIPRSVTVQISN